MNWKSTEYVKQNDLTEFYWEQGFFYTKFGNIEKTYGRDFEELRLRDISLFTLGSIKGKRVLDIGCGTGLYSLTFLKLGAQEVCGQDLSQDYIDLNSKNAKRLNFDNFVGKVGDCSSLQFEDNSFDLVFCGDVFEHIDDSLKEKFIAEAYRVLKPGGIFTLKTPNKSYLKVTNYLHRIKAILKFTNPFNIHIAHTKNNPDNEHHGLINHENLENIFLKTMFHFPVTTKTELNKGIPNFMSVFVGKFRVLNQHIIMTVKKPIFYGLYK
jgi:ubiquinone/menaquinone biosynthesis C-methylase UbiE